MVLETPLRSRWISRSRQVWHGLRWQERANIGPCRRREGALMVGLEGFGEGVHASWPTGGRLRPAGHLAFNPLRPSLDQRGEAPQEFHRQGDQGQALLERPLAGEVRLR